MFSLFNKCSVFISHKRNEGKVSFDATWFESALLEKGFKVFMDIHEDYIGNFPKVIAEKVKSCNVFLLVLPSDRDLNYLCDEKNWVHKEILYALRKVEYDEKSIKILPVSFKNNITFPPKEKLGEIAAISDYSILYCDINDQERSKQKLYNAIGYKSKNSIYTWASIMLLVVCFIIGLFMKKELMPNILFDDEDAVALFELANKQSEDHENIKAMNSYKKVKDYWESQNKYTRDYFHSYFMYLEFSRDFMEGHDLVSEYKNIINGIEQNVKFEFLSESDAIVYNRIKALTEFKLGYDYFYKIHNLDSAWYYMNQTEQYFIETKDSAKLKEIDKIKQKWVTKYSKTPELMNKKAESNREKNNINKETKTTPSKSKNNTHFSENTKNNNKSIPEFSKLLVDNTEYRTGDINENGEGVFIWENNKFVYTSKIPIQLIKTLEEIKNEGQRIKDICINNTNQWCVIWGMNNFKTSYSENSNFHQRMEKIREEEQNVLSVSINDNDEFAILTDKQSYCSNQRFNDFINNHKETFNQAVSISITNNAIIVCRLNGKFYNMNVPEKIITFLNNITKNQNQKTNLVRFTDKGHCIVNYGLPPKMKYFSE